MGLRPRLDAALLWSGIVTLFVAAGPDAAFSAPETGRPRVSLVWFDPLNALPVPAHSVGRQTEAVFEGLGVSLEWREAEDGGHTSPPEINVVLMPGTTSPTLDAHAMGAVTSSAVSRTLWVVLSNVERALGLPPSAGRRLSERDAAELARAIARVVAHEVVHIAAPRLPHSKSGLMRASLDRRALLDDGVVLDTRTHQAFVEALEGTGPRGNERLRAGSPPPYASPSS